MSPSDDERLGVTIPGRWWGEDPARIADAVARTLIEHGARLVGTEAVDGSPTRLLLETEAVARLRRAGRLARSRIVVAGNRRLIERNREHTYTVRTWLSETRPEMARRIERTADASERLAV